MELFELLKVRRSQRRFQNRPVEDNVISKILEATLTAPSSKNSRSSRFVIITNREVLEKISVMRATGSSFIKDAPMAVMVMGDTSNTDLWVNNCAISATIMQLCAQELGLGSCWVHVNGRLRDYDNPQAGDAEEYLRTIIDTPQNCRIHCFIVLGYPTEQPNPHKPKDDADKITYIK